MTIDLILTGAGAGLGLFMALLGLKRRHDTGPGPAGRPDAGRAGARSGGHTSWREPIVDLGRLIDGIVESPTAAFGRRRDLAAAGRTTEGHWLATALAALAGILGPVLLSALGRLAGIHVPGVSVLPLAAAGGVSATLGMRMELRRAARRGRDRFRWALSCWLDLVALAQAGGMGVEGALEAATRVSGDPVFGRMRQALDRSRRSGTTPWHELGRLGDRIGLDDLEELAASLALAGSEGARVRASLQAKSASLRRRLIAEAESRANATTERLFIPSIVLMVGFLVFVMYPAGVSLAHVL